LRRIFALYTNEMIKISRKISIVFIMIIMVVLVAGSGVLVRVEEYLYSKNNMLNSASDSMQMQEMQAQLKSSQTNLEDAKKKLQNVSPEEQASLQADVNTAQAQVDEYQYAVDNDINLNSSSYRAKALAELYKYKGLVRGFQALPQASLSDEMKSEIATDQSYISRLQDALQNKDLSAYISVENDIIRNDSTLSQGDKQIETESNELRLRLKLTGETDGVANMNDMAEQMIAQIETDKRSLLENVDMQYQKPLTDARRGDITNDIAVTTYKLEHHIGVTSSGTTNYKDSAMQIMFQLGDIMLIILMLILAGSSISQELSTGSIKSLIIAPARRWKIFTAKFLSLLTVLIGSGLVVYLVSSVMYGALFGFSSGSPYIYGANGAAHAINFYLYNFAYFFGGLIQVFVYMTLAFMLSIVTRNTAASVGISIAVYFGGSIINSLLLAFAKGEWLRFMPFNNLDIVSKIFPSAGSQTSGVSSVSTSLSFSLIYLAVLVFCMGYTAFDSFTRRDIK
jgi:ABC-2 type transport system permease protein